MPLSASLLLLPALAMTPFQDRPGSPFVTRSEVFARHAMVATSQPLATQAGLEILRAGGNAFDAAIAANAVLGVVEPTGCGVGGDLFVLGWDAKGKRLHGLNASGRSPRGLTLERMRALAGDAIPALGPLPVTVPGCVDGWFTLHAKLGQLPMRTILAPAIRLAREGFPVSELIARAWERNGRLLADQPGFAEQFLPAPAKGTLFRREGLAGTLAAIAEGGRDAFYTGPLARRMAEYLKENGGFLTEQDFAAHRSEWVEPVSTSYRGVELWELPPNGQGIAALQMLNVLEGYDLSALGFGSPEVLHVLVEAKKLAFEDRARYYADPAFAEVPVARLISKEYAAGRRALVDRTRAATRVEAGKLAGTGTDTVTLAVGDAEGNLVSLIQSNYRGMGSGMAPPGMGFVFQDRGELFDLEPGRPNSYAPGKRPFHTIIPGFVTRGGEPWIAFGVMGGDFQPQGHVQILMNLVDFGMNLQEAGDAPRVAHEGSSTPTGEPLAEGGGTVALESGFPAEVRERLAALGHVLQDHAGIFGGYQAVARDPETGVLTGASDARKDGQAAGW